MSLYASLFRYRSRASRSPLEDFLTEALVALLNKMPRSTVLDLVSDAFLNGNKECSSKLRDLAANEQNMEWSTQKSIDRGRLDILLKIDGIPTLIVENKVSARITPGSSQSESESEVGGDGSRNAKQKKENQLMWYGRWLKNQRKGHSWSGALIFLTLNTSPPIDFGDGNKEYGVSSQHTCRWPTVWRWIRKVTPSSEQCGQHSIVEPWRVYADELADFLEEYNMASDDLSLNDIIAAQNYMNGRARLHQFFRLIKESIAAQMKSNKLFTGRITELKYDDSGGAIWGWTYIKTPLSPKDDVWYISWGIRFPDSSGWPNDYQPRLPERPHAFVGLMSDNEEIPIPKIWVEKLTSLSGWACLLTPDDRVSEVIVPKALLEFPQGPEEMTRHISEWIRAQVQSVAQAVQAG